MTDTADSSRSKKRFNLPSIVSRPPCPPRIYKKLYNYLSSALPSSDATREPQTPSKKTESASAPTRTTPKTPLSGRMTPRTARKVEGNVAEIPDWVMPAIRSLVKAFDYSSAAPHVFTGIESILPLLARMSTAAAETPSKRPKQTLATSQGSSDTVSDVRTFALIVVVFLYVFTRMKDVDVSPDQYQQWRVTAINTLLSTPAAKDMPYDDLSLKAQEMMPIARAEGWLQMDWFINVAPVEDTDDMVGVELTESNASNGAIKSIVAKSGGSDYIGLGTMMQDATDYLDERRRQNYSEWKAQIMARVQEIETA